VGVAVVVLVLDLVVLVEVVLVDIEPVLDYL
jgi:hypothetical protein